MILVLREHVDLSLARPFTEVVPRDQRTSTDVWWRFSTSSGQSYTVTASRMGTPGDVWGDSYPGWSARLVAGWSIEFENDAYEGDDSVLNNTGGYSEVNQIFATVGAVIREFTRSPEFERQPVIYLANDARSKSRTALYTRFARELARGIPGYTAESVQGMTQLGPMVLNVVHPSGQAIRKPRMVIPSIHP